MLAGTTQARFPPEQAAPFPRVRTAARLHDWDHAPIHLGDDQCGGLGRIRWGQRGDGFAVAQGVLPHRCHRNFHGVMFPHAAHRLAEGNFRAEIRQHPLQPQGIAAMFDLGFPAEGPELRAAAFDAHQLFDHRHRPEGRQPTYFFLMCLMDWGC